MSEIKVSNLTFSYNNSGDYVFKDVSFTLSDEWKIGLIGKNGAGKTTFLNLLLGNYEYSGTITSKVNFEYFPFKVESKKLNAYEILKKYTNNCEQWKLEKETNLLNINIGALNRPFSTLSMGEQNKILLAILFLKDRSFLLIDEPTNHLDLTGRQSVSNYLNSKSGFIVASHDRTFLDTCINHVLYINKTTIGIEQGNFSSWYKNKTEKDNWELNENKKLKNKITVLEKSSRQATLWSSKAEKSKYNIEKGIAKDKGYIGHKAAKMMKRAVSAKKRKEKIIEKNSGLLKDIELVENLKIEPLVNPKGRLLEFCDFSIMFNDHKIFKENSFYIENGDKVQLKGKNGCGKSSILKVILGMDIHYTGKKFCVNNLKFSYVPQNFSDLSGTLDLYAKNNQIDESIFKTILVKLGVKRDNLDKDIRDFSNGQKKKVLIAKSLCEKANIYVWDEPLNYIDTFSQIQLENLLLKYNLTMIFVEHDKAFAEKITTKIVNIEVA